MMLSTSQKFRRVMIYGTLGTACILALVLALVAPDELDVFEAQVAAVYLVLLIGGNKAFNAKPVLGNRILGAVAAFTGTGLLPAAIIHIALAQVEQGQSAHLETLVGFGVVTVGTALLTFIPSLYAHQIWQIYEERQRQRNIETTPSWVPRLN